MRAKYSRRAVTMRIAGSPRRVIIREVGILRMAHTRAVVILRMMHTRAAGIPRMAHIREAGILRMGITGMADTSRTIIIRRIKLMGRRDITTIIIKTIAVIINLIAICRLTGTAS